MLISSKCGPGLQIAFCKDTEICAFKGGEDREFAL